MASRSSPTRTARRYLVLFGIDQELAERARGAGRPYSSRSLAQDPAYELDLADTARLLAMMNLSGADAAINCWNDKYHFDFWRPWEAIRKADLDDSPATEADPWTPLLTAPYPEHASRHLCLDGAHLRVLQMVFGTGRIRFGVASSQFGGEARYSDRFRQAFVEIIEARIWAGLHFRTADVGGGSSAGTSLSSWPVTASSQWTDIPGSCRRWGDGPRLRLPSISAHAIPTPQKPRVPAA